MTFFVLITFNDVSYSKEVFAKDVTMITTTRHYVSLWEANNINKLRRFCTACRFLTEE